MTTLPLPSHTAPQISVIICTYNNAAVLDQALEALSLQEAAPEGWECVVVDNNSTDQTAEVVERWRLIGRIPGLRRVTEPTQGLAFARLRGVTCTRSEFIAWVDDDCLLDKDWVAGVKAWFSEPGRDRVGLLGGRVELMYENEPACFVRELEGALASQDHGGSDTDMTRVSRACLVGAGMVLRRRALEESGWLKCQSLSDRRGGALSSGGDTEVTIRIRQSGWSAWYTPRLKLSHMIPEGRTTLAYFERLYRGFGHADPYLDRLYFIGPRFGVRERLRLARISVRAFFSGWLAWSRFPRSRKRPPDGSDVEAVKAHLSWVRQRAAFASFCKIVFSPR